MELPKFPSGSIYPSNTIRFRLVVLESVKKQDDNEVTVVFVVFTSIYFQSYS